jgi:hypothetical protein
MMPRKKKENPPQEDRPDSPRGYVRKPITPVKLDAKFYGAIYKAKDNSSVSDDQYMVFLAKDNAFPATLAFYLEECVRLGADAEHIESVMRTQRRLNEWREANPDLCKVPDARGEKLLG